LKGGFGYIIVCLTLYTIAMEGVRFFAHQIGVFGGLLTMAACMARPAGTKSAAERSPEITPSTAAAFRLTYRAAALSHLHFRKIGRNLRV
jgi:hypothetical protein